MGLRIVGSSFQSMSTKNKKNAAPEAADAVAGRSGPATVLAQIRGREINPEFLVMGVPTSEGGFLRARMRVPRRFGQAFKKNAVVRVMLTEDPHVVEAIL